MEMNSIHDLLEMELQDVFSAENQILKALPKMKKGTECQHLREAIDNHLEETRLHVERLNQIGEFLDIKLKGRTCAAMEGLIKEGQEILGEGEAGFVKDNAIIAALQKVEHYEIATYGTLRTWASRVGQNDVVNLLEQTLDEEKMADEKLTEIAVSLQDVIVEHLEDMDEADAEAETVRAERNPLHPATPPSANRPGSALRGGSRKR